MPRICYTDKDFRASTLEIIGTANAIIADYMADGLALTLRQLYYQFVARDLLPNTQQSYNRLGSIVNDARLAGLVDWSAIEDRGRNLQKWHTYDSPADAIREAAATYLTDRWADQPHYVEVWVEKQALEGVVNKACEPYDVPHIACKGYMSQSEMWAAGERFNAIQDAGREVVVIHLGDHDPSGLDMTRDIGDRLELFTWYTGVDLRRIALNMPQVEEFNCPPNPAKLSDSRIADYIREHGRSSWELDALEPRYLVDRIQEEISSVLDWAAWDLATAEWEEGRRALRAFVDEHETEA